MFSKVFDRPDDTSREWSRMVERYIALHKYIKDVGKLSISQARSGHVKDDVQLKLSESLIQADKALLQLKEFFKPCLTNGLAVEDPFVENSKEEEKSLHNKALETQIRDVQQQLLEKDKLFEGERQQLIEENVRLHQRFTEADDHCQMLALKINDLADKENTNQEFNDETLKIERQFSHSGENLEHQEELQTLHKRQHIQFEETLKTQNDLIEDLKQQLSDSNREREILRNLNVNIERELRKKGQTNEESEINEEQPAVLKAGDLEWITAKFQKYQSHIQSLQQQLTEQQKQFEEERQKNENNVDVDDYRYKIQTLQEILNLRTQELENLTVENLRLQQENSQARPTDYATEKDGVKEDPKTTTFQVEQLKQLLVDANYERDVLKFENDGLHEQLHHLTQLVERLKARNASLENQVQTNMVRISSLAEVPQKQKNTGEDGKEPSQQNIETL